MIKHVATRVELKLFTENPHGRRVSPTENLKEMKNNPKGEVLLGWPKRRKAERDPKPNALQRKYESLCFFNSYIFSLTSY